MYTEQKIEYLLCQLFGKNLRKEENDMGCDTIGKVKGFVKHDEILNYKHKARKPTVLTVG